MSKWIVPCESEKIESDLKDALDLLEYFTNRVEEGSIRSHTTYLKYKQFLSKFNSFDSLAETMTIYAKSGHKVTVTAESIKNGYDSDKERASKFLKIGEIYTVSLVRIGQSHSSVELLEIPAQIFNTVQFVDFTD